MSMSVRTRYFGRFAHTPTQHAQWRPLPRRHYSTTPPIEPEAAQKNDITDDGQEPEWFRKLRKEMLSRKLSILYDIISQPQEKKLANTLKAFLPAEYQPILSPTKKLAGSPPGSVGNHLIFFNPSLPADKLLPDGTDPLHSPGEPFVRRMWAGGSVKVNSGTYFDSETSGWERGVGMLCAERIKEVRLRGQGDAAKIFVTIERRVASLNRLMKAPRKIEAGMNLVPRKVLQKQLRKSGGENDALLTEERNLVFMRERSVEQLQAIKAGEMAPTKYLQSPGKPDFSHACTPTSSLLFRFSALTFNAHSIHLDREYCRTAEGHRNLLVHGPLTLMLMIKFITAHLHGLPGHSKIVQSIEYRNLAPLYCDEELKICARAKTGGSDDNSTYDVWIEGPTGGMAVKGTVRAASRPEAESPRPPKKSEEKARKPEELKSIVRRVGGATNPTLRILKTAPDDVHRTKIPLSKRRKLIHMLEPKPSQSSPFNVGDDAVAPIQPSGDQILQPPRPSEVLATSLPHDTRSIATAPKFPIPLAGISIQPINAHTDPIILKHRSRRLYRRAMGLRLGVFPRTLPSKTFLPSTDPTPSANPRVEAPSGQSEPTTNLHGGRISETFMRDEPFQMNVAPTLVIRKYPSRLYEQNDKTNKYGEQGPRKMIPSKPVPRKVGVFRMPKRRARR